MTRPLLGALGLLACCLLASAASAYWNYDPASPPAGGPHRRINEYAWKMLLITRLTEADKPDPILQQYRLKDQDLRAVAGDTVVNPGGWSNDISVGRTELSVAGWVAEGGYTADEPELYMCLRHFYDPTKPDGQRYLTDIPWLGKFREQVRRRWRTDVEVKNPETDARAWALSRQENSWGWQQGLASMRKALGPLEFSRGERDRLAADAWRALGETMHLMADMTVPAHVRNDGHPGKLPAGDLRPDPYEDLCLAPEIDAAFRSIPRTGGWQKLDLGAAMDDEIGGAVAGAGTPSALFQAVAAYVNKRFLTPDTLTGVDSEGKPVTPLNGQLYPMPKLGGDVTSDGLDGTYSRTFQRRGPVAMVHETWQTNGFGDWLRNLGATRTLATTKDCVVSQARTLVPIAIAANLKLLDWYLPRFQVTITSIDSTKPEQPLAGKVEHKAQGAWSAPVEVTLPKDGIIELFVDGVRQDPRNVHLTLVKGVLSGTLPGVKLADAKRVWVEVELAGLRVASVDYAPQGSLYVRVCKPQDQVQVGPQNMRGTLGGVPILGVEVVVTYTVRGKAETLRAKTGKDGDCRFLVPLGVLVTVETQGQRKTATCTPDKPRQAVTFGWQGHDPTQDAPPDDIDSPYLTGEAGFEK